MKKNKANKAVRFLTVLLSLTMILSITGVSETKAWAGSETSGGWLISAENTAGGLPSEAAQAFGMAVQSYEGETLVPLACYGTQVVAGINYYLICRQGAQLKKVVVYENIQEQSIIASVENFNLDDYAKNYDYTLPTETLCGGVEVYTSGSRCTPPQEAATVFDAVYGEIDGAGMVPVAYLGSKSDNGTDYAFLCLKFAVVMNPDYYVDIVILHKDADEPASQKTSYSLLGTRGHYSYYDETQMTGWKQEGGKWYYLENDGVMATGWKQVSGKWYYLGGNGVMVTGWKQISGKWYYMNGSGVMVTGWKKLGGKWYYLDGSGVMATGWKKLGGKWYYLDGSGAMVTGWKQINGKWYYFKNSGEMAEGEWCGGYWLNQDGTWTYGYKASWKQDSTGWWYGDASGWYAKNTIVTIDGKIYCFNANGYLQ